MNITEKRTRPAWYMDIRKYEQPSLWKASWQLMNTFIPYLLFLFFMYLTIRLDYPYWISLIVAVPAAGLLGRIFIFFHDCVHGSYFKYRWANTTLGYICGVLTLTAYNDWRHAHGIHHSTAGDLDRRGVGDVWTLTVNEYLSTSRKKRFAYRFFRNPFVLICLIPTFLLLISHRFPHRVARKPDRYSVYLNNFIILIIVIMAFFTIGLREFVLIMLPVIIIHGTVAVWVFFIQHQFEGVNWVRHNEWDLINVGMMGSSYYKLPKILQWLTGNIGYHHIHHVRPRIPNYNLQRCYDETPELQMIMPLTIRNSLKSMKLSLWDEEKKELVGFRAIKDLARKRDNREKGSGVLY